MKESAPSRPLNIWLPALRVGSGAEVFMQRLEQGLRKAGHQPTLQWFDARYELTPWRLRSFAPPAETDVIHAGSWQGFAFKRPGVPLVVTEHQYIRHPAFVPQTGTMQRLYHRLFVDRCVARSYRAADTIVAVSDHVAAQMRKDLGQPIEMVHNGVDTDRFGPVTEEAPTRDHAAPFRLLFVGNPSRWKGADLLAPLAAMLGPAFEIQCVSGLRGDRFPAGGAGLRMLPPVASDDMPELYRQSDAVLIPTRYEAFGYVALEAMACGKPVVGFASTGTAEVCVHGQTALLAPMDDLQTLAAHVRRLALKPELCARLGAAGRQRAVHEFSQAQAIAGYTTLYTRVLNDVAA